MPSSNWAKLQIDGGLLRKLDKGQLPNLKNLDPAVQAQLARMDPGNEYMVNWLWGYTTVGINVDKVKAALGDDADARQRLGPGLQARVHQQAEVLRRVASSTRPPRSSRPRCTTWASRRSARTRRTTPAAANLLKAVRPYVTLFSSSGYINDMANGSICVALGWSGDINIARQRAIDGKTGQNIQALIPKTGGLLFFDVMVIPADAPHPGNAHKFINYILRPEVSASLTNKVFYANPNTASKPFVKPEVASNPTVFLPPADLKKMVAAGLAVATTCAA